MDERERLFVEYWEARRLKEKSLLYQVLTGLPIGLLFGIPIILVLFSGRFWYKRADMVANSESSTIILMIAILLIALFVAVIYKRHQWEMKEQQYLEIKARESQKK
jgi:hypothetical protein